MPHEEHDDSHGEVHHAPTAHYYQQVSRNKTIGRILFIVVLLAVLIVLFLLFKGLRARSAPANTLAAQAALSQGNVRYVALGEQFDLMNNETAFVRDTDASVKILGYAYQPCVNDTKCVQKGFQVNYELVNRGVQYKSEYGKSVNTALFPYDVRVLGSDYQTFARFVIYPQGQAPAVTTQANSNSSTTTTSHTNTVSNTNSNLTDSDSTTTSSSVTWKKIAIAGRTFSYPSNWIAELHEPSLCRGVHMSLYENNVRTGEVFMYEDGECSNPYITDPDNYIELKEVRHVDHVKIFIVRADTSTAKADIEKIIDKL